MNNGNSNIESKYINDFKSWFIGIDTRTRAWIATAFSIIYLLVIIYQMIVEIDSKFYSVLIVLLQLLICIALVFLWGGVECPIKTSEFMGKERERVIKAKKALYQIRTVLMVLWLSFTILYLMFTVFAVIDLKNVGIFNNALHSQIEGNSNDIIIKQVEELNSKYDIFSLEALINNDAQLKSYFINDVMKNSWLNQNKIKSLAQEFFGDCAMFCIFLCYYILTFTTVIKIKDRQESKLPIVQIMCTIILILTVKGLILFALDRCDINSDNVNDFNIAGILKWFDLISGICGGVFMVMLIGRLDSKYLGAPYIIIALLYLYGVMQAGVVVFDDLQMKNVMFIIALPLKCILFGLFVFLIQSGRLLFFLIRIAEIYRDGENERGEFIRKYI